MRTPNTVILVCFCLIINISFGQNFSPLFKNISKELPSSEVHDIIEDSLGYIWLATDRGITRFDGQNFKDLNTEQHFTSSTFQFFMETNEKIWFNTGDNELYWFNPLIDVQVIHPYIFNDTVTKIINKTSKAKFIRMLYMQGNACKITFLKGTGYIDIDKNGNGAMKNRIAVEYQNHKTSNLYINHGNNFSFTEFEHTESSHEKLSMVSNNYQDTLLLSDKFSYNNFWLYGISDIKKHNKDTYLLLSQYLIRYNEQNISYIELPSEGIKLFVDDDNFFVCTFKGVFEIDKNFKIIDSFLNDYSVTSALKDHENGFWFSTLNSGVFYTKNVALKYLDNSSKIAPTLMMFKKNNLCVMDNNKQLVIYSKEGDLINTYKSVYNINYLFSSPNPNLAYYLDPYVFVDSNFQIYAYYPQYNLNTTLQASSTVIHDFNKDNPRVVKEFTNIPFINDCFPINDSIILVATKKGLYNYNINRDSLLLDERSLNINCKTIKKIRNSLLITSNNGLYIYKNGNLSNINTSHGLLDNELEGAHIQNDSTIWLYSYKGLNKLLFSNESLSRIERFTALSGLGSNEITSLTSDSNKIWIGTKDGICKINKNFKLSDEQLNSKYFLVDSIVLNNDQFFQSSDTIKISHGSKLNLFFKYITYRKDKPIQFEYQIDSSEWTQTNPNSLIIQNETPGSHILKIRGKGHPEYILFQNTIIITPPLTELLWFRICIAFIILLLTILILKAFLRYKDRKKEAELDKINLELKLLTSQMNPHFTFNSINSIQHYILKNNKNEAIKYLSDFALLIRQTLDFSFNNSISIETEINFLKLYLELENKRFESNFILELDIHESVDIHTTRMPSLLLQPLIENVILHAKYWENQEKKITLYIYDFGGYRLFKVIDYGITGYKSTNLSKHKSYGLEIIRNRLKIYNGKNYNSSDLTFSPTNKELQTGNTTTIKLYKNEDNYS